jgi:hypothetical protein
MLAGRIISQKVLPLLLKNAQHPLRHWRFFMKYAIIGSGEILSGPISKSEILMKDSACERTLRLHFSGAAPGT